MMNEIFQLEETTRKRGSGGTCSSERLMRASECVRHSNIEQNMTRLCICAQCLDACGMARNAESRHVGGCFRSSLPTGASIMRVKWRQGKARQCMACFGQEQAELEHWHRQQQQQHE